MTPAKPFIPTHRLTRASVAPHFIPALHGHGLVVGNRATAAEVVAPVMAAGAVITQLFMGTTYAKPGSEETILGPDSWAAAHDVFGPELTRRYELLVTAPPRPDFTTWILIVDFDALFDERVLGEVVSGADRAEAQSHLDELLALGRAVNVHVLGVVADERLTPWILCGSRGDAFGYQWHPTSRLSAV